MQSVPNVTPLLVDALISAKLSSYLPNSVSKRGRDFWDTLYKLTMRNIGNR